MKFAVPINDCIMACRWLHFTSWAVVTVSLLWVGFMYSLSWMDGFRERDEQWYRILAEVRRCRVVPSHPPPVPPATMPSFSTSHTVLRAWTCWGLMMWPRSACTACAWLAWGGSLFGAHLLLCAQLGYCCRR